MKFLRSLLSTMAVAAGVLWSCLLLPLRKEQMPFSGWGDGAGGSAATLEGPVLFFWFATILAFVFICIKPHFRSESGWVRVGRWLTNVALFFVAIALLFYAKNGPAVRFLALYGFVALIGLWIYLDLKGRKNGSPNLQP